MEACFSARFRQEGTRHGVPGAQEFITKATEELQEARAMRGDRRPPPGAAPCPGEDDELRVSVNIPGLNRAASQERFVRWLVRGSTSQLRLHAIRLA